MWSEVECVTFRFKLALTSTKKFRRRFFKCIETQVQVHGKKIALIARENNFTQMHMNLANLTAHTNYYTFIYHKYYFF